MFIKNFKKTKCVNGCVLFNDNSSYLYWENRNATQDEIEIVDYINKKLNKKNLSILHIGVGNSYVASNIKFFKKLHGLSISTNEINYANSLKISNYKSFFLNKLEKNIFLNNNFSFYDVIIDVNLKSFCCCDVSFLKLIQDYSSLLSKGGFIITGKRGMNWSRQVKPVLKFSLKKFFYKRLKEFDGPKSNLLSINYLKSVAKKFDLFLYDFKSSNIVTLTKS